MMEKKEVISHSAARLVLLFVLAMALTACSATGSRVKAYDGPELAESDTATLTAPENIEVLRVNDKEQGLFLLQDFAVDYSLRPGTNRVIFQYRSIWAKNDARENGDSAVTTVQSKPMEVSFDAEPGTVYTFRFPEPDNVRQARKLAQAFSATVVTGSGEVVARASAYSAGEPEPAGSGERRDMAERSQETTTVPSGLSTLEALNLLWKRASREEKEAFLQQAFD